MNTKVKAQTVNHDVPTDFTPENLVYQASGTSVKVKLKKNCFDTFLKVVSKLYGDKAQKCDVHNLRYLYHFIEVPAGERIPAHFKVITSLFVGSAPEKVATLTLYPSTQKVHLQGNMDNVNIYILSHLSKLMDITNSIQIDDIADLHCIACHDLTPVDHVDLAPHSADSSPHDVNNAPHPPPLTSTPSCSRTRQPILSLLTPLKCNNSANSTRLFGSLLEPGQRTYVPATPVISKYRETTLISQVLNKVDQIEDIVSQKNVAHHAHDNRLCKLEETVAQLTQGLDSQKALSNRQNDLINEQSYELNRYADKHKQLWSRVKEAEAANHKLRDKLSHMQCNHPPVHHNIVSPPPARPVPQPRKRNLYSTVTSAPAIHPHPTKPPGPPRPPPTTAPPPLMSAKPTLPKQPSVTVMGTSNLGKISSALRNTIPNVTIKSVPGATYDHMIGDIVGLEPCDILVLSGGVNEAKSLDDPELARQPIRDAINTAKHRAEKVVIMPPPPIEHPRTRRNIQQISDILWWEAQHAGVEYVDVSSAFHDPRLAGEFLWDKQGIHVTALSGGIYAHHLLAHLSHHHPDVKLAPTLCVKCHRTGHKFATCQANRTPTQTAEVRKEPHSGYYSYNRFQPLSHDSDVMPWQYSRD